MMILLKHFIRSLIDWVFRRRSPALLIVRIALPAWRLPSARAGRWTCQSRFRTAVLMLALTVLVAHRFVLVWATTVLGLILILAGFVWEVFRYRAEQRRIARKKIIVIEARGLRDTGGAPLIEALPPRFEGQRDHVLVDLRQGVKDGEIVAPEAVLEDLISLSADLKRRENGFDRRDLTLVYGGLTPVPFTFLTGVLIDDEGAAFILDWDRHAEAWRELNSADDGKRFQTAGLDNVPHGAEEVALAVSVSYGVNADDVRAQFGNIPVVELHLEDGSPDCHWSEKKQRALGRQFLEAAIGLGNRGVWRIHVFLAAQNSIAFRFGRLYDKRNLPEVAVYQYQRNAIPPYPWGVLMPVCGIDRPTIIDLFPFKRVRYINEYSWIVEGGQVWQGSGLQRNRSSSSCERRACRVLGQARSTNEESDRFPRKRHNWCSGWWSWPVSMADSGTGGSRRCFALEGWKVNPKRVERLWGDRRG